MKVIEIYEQVLGQLDEKHLEAGACSWITFNYLIENGVDIYQAIEEIHTINELATVTTELEN